MIQKIIYYALFYVCWVICVQQASVGNGFIGPILIFIVVILHLLFTKDARREALFIVIISLAGTLIDTLYMNTGLMRFNSLYPNFPYIAPLWITSLYSLFAAGFTQSFGWLKERWWTMIVFGAIGGPLSYLAAMKVGAGEFLVPVWVGMIILGIVWSTIFPICFLLFKYLKSA